ncbi:MAG: hypothetical protein FWD58_03710 [Firmicutes bacterium]|nr:hypothetical protein [Bacillota bacterium]
MSKEATSSCFSAPDIYFKSPVERLKHYFGDWYVYDNYEQASIREEKFRKLAMSVGDFGNKLQAIDDMLRAAFAVHLHERLHKGQTAQQIIGAVSYRSFAETQVPAILKIIGQDHEESIRDEFWFSEVGV